ncbi:MAG TPA: Ig-like domain-containing protein, partial [Gemmatimonadales bacterium]|nr:Ig-like domain-containing protein [Gemmatimonadales bacterium]
MLGTRTFTALLAAVAVSLTAACSDSTGTTTTTTLTNVSPAGNATGVAVTAPVVLTFSDSMGQGMEAYMDVHQGTTATGTMPMTCTWSADRTTLTCTHASPFAPGTMYTVHVGAGMKDADGMPVGMGDMMAQ